MSEETTDNGHSEPRDENRNSVPILTAGIGTRIKECAGDVGGARRLAEVIGLSEAQIHRIFTGKNQPKAETIAAISKATGRTLEWLVFGKAYSVAEPANLAIRDGDTQEYGKNSSFSLVPLYDVRASAGHGAILNQENILDYLAFKRDWLHRELGAIPSDLYLINVDGESMEPTLRSGDLILVDPRGAGEIPRDGVYVLRMDGTLLVKRLQRLPGRRVKVSSDNTAYESFELDLDHWVDDLAIIGRVVWTGRRV